MIALLARITFCTAVLALLPHLSQGAVTYVVSPQGKDSNPGTRSAPLCTIQKAALLAVPGDTVLVHAGVYRETVTPKNSGQPGEPITYRAFPGETVTISGAEPMTGWERQRGSVYQAKMPAGFYHSRINYADQIFMDGRMLNQARWPNTSLDVSSPAKSTLTKFISKTRDKATNWTTAVFEDANLTPAVDGYYVGAEIFLQPNKEAWSWAFTGTVIGQKGTQLTIKTRSDTGQDGNQSVYAVGSRYYLFNKKELMDAPGEWFHDLSANTLLLETMHGDDPAKHVVEARARDYAFYLDGLSYLTIQGFHLFACTITTDAAAGSGVEWDAQGNDLYPWRKSDSLPSSHDIVLDGLTAKYVSHFTDRSGHFFLQWGSNTGLNISGTRQTIQNCHVQYSAGNGIVSYGRACHITNNLIEDTDYGAVDDAGISTLGGLGAFDFDIGNNTVRRTGRSGMILRGLQNSDAARRITRVHHNDVSDFMLQDFDGGATYTFGQDAKFVRVDHNWFHEATGNTVSGFYTDYSKNWIVDHNVIWNVDWAIHLEGAHQSGVVDALVYNNTTLSRGASIGIGNGQAPGSFFLNNIFNHPLGKAEASAKLVRDNLIWDNRAGSATDPRFADGDHGDFRLQASSPARGMSKAPGAFAAQQPGSVDILVSPEDGESAGKQDAGAYRYGAPVWTAGSSLKASSLPPAAPSRLTVRAASAAQINLAWQDNSSSELGFAVERKTGGHPFVQIGLVGANAAEFYDSGLACSTSYTYRLRAVNSAGSSSYTKAAETKTPAQTNSDARLRRTQTAPMRDGSNAAVWDAAPVLPLAHWIQGDANLLPELDASWKGLWDDQNLYLRVEVADPVLSPASARLAWYDTDGVELFLDADNSKKNEYDGLNDFQIGFLWGAKNAVFGQNSVKTDSQIPFHMTRTSRGYRLDVALPWKILLSYAPKPGALLGLDVHVNDNDDGIRMKGKKSWFATGSDLWMHPQKFATVELISANAK